MKQTFKALLMRASIVVFLVSATDIHARSEESSSLKNEEPFKLTGCWLFEKAEYLEQSSTEKKYQLKDTIKYEEDLVVLGSCYQEAVKKICFYNEESAKIICMFTTYVGNVKFPSGTTLVAGKKQRMIFGVSELDGEASFVDDMEHNAPQIEYQVEVLNNETLCITLEKSCYKNGATLHGIVKCILKRETE